MNKYITVEDKTQEIELDILPQEHAFRIKLIDLLNDSSYQIIKSLDTYCSIDFCIINTRNLKTIYLEHKERHLTSNKYKSTIINKCKLLSYKNNYPKTLMCWSYKSNALKFVQYREDFLNNASRFIKNQEVIFIDNSLLSDGYDELIKTIKNNLK
jgi:hypothetical protein